MSNDIKVGDLVYVNKPQLCCGREESIGKHFIVTNLHKNESYCIGCGKDTGVQVLASDDSNHRAGFDIRRLKKIEPLSDTDTTQEIKEIENVE